MAYKRTGRPVGRPKTKEYGTLLARVPQELINRVKDYCNTHNLTISELIRDGLERCMSQEDIPYNSNTSKTSIPNDTIQN
jgi:antitoxin component of RelBE/YafQ-DinJ toxin-antitoxin module